MGKRTASKSTLLLMELIIVILIFALCATICMGLFSTSHTMTRDSDQLNHAVALSRTAANCYKAAEGDLVQVSELLGASSGVADETQFLAYYDKHWQMTSTASDAAFYLQITPLTDASAPLQEAEIAVCVIDGEVVFKIPVRKAVLHTGGERYGTD